MNEYTMFSKYFRVESLVVSRQNIFYFETKKVNLDYSLVFNNLISYSCNKIRKTQNEHLNIVCQNLILSFIYTTSFLI